MFAEIILDFGEIGFFQELALDIGDDDEIAVVPVRRVVEMGDEPGAEQNHEGAGEIGGDNIFLDQGKDGEGADHHANGLPHDEDVGVDVVEHLIVHFDQKFFSIVEHGRCDSRCNSSKVN